MATYSSNTTIKVFGAASIGQVLAANQYAVVSYYGGGVGDTGNRYYGPGSTIVATYAIGGFGVATFISGVVFQNSP